MSDQHILQVSTPIKRGEMPQVVLRVSDDRDLDTAVALVNRAAEEVAPLMAGLATTLADALDQGANTAPLQAGGLNPHIVGTDAMTGGGSTYEAKPTTTALLAESGPCWTGSMVGGRRDHDRSCPECGSPTLHTLKDLRGRSVNAHICAVNPTHKIVWCEDPIWNSRKAKALGMGIQINPGLNYD